MINLLYCGNYKVFDGLLMSLLSACKHTQSELNVYVVTMYLTDINPEYKPISAKDCENIENVIKKVNKNNKIIRIDATEQYKKELGNSKNVNTRCTPYTMLRLLADKLPLPEKIIYLDTDTLINNDLQEYFDIDIENFEVACVKDILPKVIFYPTYFNAGSLLLNLKLIKQTKSFEKAINLCLTKKMQFCDQDALNYSITKRKLINPKFNAFRHRCRYYPEIVVHHICNVPYGFNKRMKPWQFDMFSKRFPMYKNLIAETIEYKNMFKK